MANSKFNPRFFDSIALVKVWKDKQFQTIEIKFNSELTEIELNQFIKRNLTIESIKIEDIERVFKYKESSIKYKKLNTLIK